MNNGNEEIKELPEADYKEWQVLKAFDRLIGSIDASYFQRTPISRNYFLKLLREAKYKKDANR